MAETLSGEIQAEIDRKTEERGASIRVGEKEVR